MSDLRYALRSLLRRPGFAAVAALTLALGIGANTAIFSVLHAALLRPLPFPEPARLMQLHVTVRRAAEAVVDSTVWSYPKFETMRRAQHSFEHVAAYSVTNVNLTGTGDPERFAAELVSGSYFDMLRVPMARGRSFAAEEDGTPGTHPVAVIGHALWARRFGADPDILGRTIELDKQRLTVIGVAPPGFAGLTGRAKVWIPLAMAPVLSYPEALQEQWSHWLEVAARLRPGITVEQAEAEVRALGRLVHDAHPLPRATGDAWGATAQPMRDARTDPVLRRSVLVLFGAVGFVLLIACVNVANLLLAHAVGRRREIAVRTALGAGRGRLVRQLLTESALLSLLGAALGVLVAVWGVDALSSLQPETLGGVSSQAAQFLDLSALRLDLPVLAFSLALALLTGVLFGLIPALQATRADLTGALKEGSAGAMQGAPSLRRASARSLLITGEVALSLVLLIGAGLMLKSFARVRGIDPGFDPARILTFRMMPPPDSIYSFRNAPTFKEQLVERLRAVPGVEGVSVNACTPLSRACNGSVIMRIAGRPPFAEGSEPTVGVHAVGPEYFRVLGTPVVRGRAFTPQDRRGAPKVVMINEAAARRFFPGEDPIGRRIAVGIGFFRDDETAEIVGVAGDVRYGALTDEVEPDVYVPALAYTHPGGMYLLRTRGDPAAAVPAVRRAVLAFDKDLPIYDVRTMEERVGDALSQMRFGALLLSVFAGAALLLAAVGLYGVMAYAVGERTHEIGLRMALGAQRRDVLRLVVGQGLALTAAGLGAGLVASLGLTRVLVGLLYGVTATDPWTFAALSLLLAAVAALACYLPARRATAVDPMVALRHE